ncbi:unnamed protein product [Arabidopsis thaliana]|uniref:F-box domain-containing protein n=1 Tax=Arabidopsis thaliana TaxID=3702 RepID=A0A654G663_ARATH|nr:unnamed protein product [Arabidopsis thaliana]
MDLLSNLPYELLCHILSFLTTKEAALTSVLSKRWRNLIAFVPNVDIVDHDFLYPENRKEERSDIRELFMDFVDRVLALQGNSPINKFSLDCSGVDSDRVDCWIQNVMVRGVSEINLSIFVDSLPGVDYNLFPKVFENKKLVKLGLSYMSWLDGSIFLPMLKTLVLENVSLSSDKFEILLHALPALEELVMNHIYWIERDVVDIMPKLKMENLFEARISLFVVEEDISRVRALINNDLLEDDEYYVLRFENLWKLMNGIRNVRYLVLSPNTLEVLSLCCETMPVFKNLKSLSIKSDESGGGKAMPVLLRNCPHLETLVLEGLLHHVTDKCGDACDCVSREDKGRSLTSCLVKVLEIKGFQGTTKEMNMIKHFLEYFPCLKELKMYMEENDPAQLRVPEVITGEMMERYKKSSSCNVQLLVGGKLYKKWTP